MGASNIGIAGIVPNRDVPIALDADIRWLGGQQIGIETPVDADMTIYNIAGQVLQQKRLSSGYHQLTIHASNTVVIVHVKKGNQSITKRIWVSR
ncbi:MAG: T9SS type A sorting domain-containing protein [Saprospiraceae bacterium]